MNIGQKVLSELKKEITKLEYDRYIKRLVYDTQNSKSNIVYFHAQNIIIAKWVKSNYKEQIIHLFDIQNQVKPELEIVVFDKSEKVSNPVAVRYAWSNWVEGTLYDTNLLPASSFRTDEWDDATRGEE